MDRLRVAIHLHTHYSHDSNQSPADILAAAERERIDVVAITDHDEIDGAREAREISERGGSPVRVIVGEEVSSRDGHIIGLFLQRRIEPWMSAEETIAAIREQGGVVLAPHPFSTLCDNSLRANVERIVPLIDAMEIHNAQNPWPRHDALAARFAAERAIAPFVGCDGHIRGQLAPAYQTMPTFRGPTEFLTSLRQADLTFGRYGPRYFLGMIGRHIWDCVFPRRLPGFGVKMPDRSARPQPIAVKR